jgi:hypothetical protein
LTAPNPEIKKPIVKIAAGSGLMRLFALHLPGQAQILEPVSARYSHGLSTAAADPAFAKAPAGEPKL